MLKNRDNYNYKCKCKSIVLSYCKLNAKVYVLKVRDTKDFALAMIILLHGFTDYDARVVS